MSEDARSLGTLAAAEQGQILLRLQNAQTLFCEYCRQCSSSGNCVSASASWCTVYTVARPGDVLKISQAHDSRAAEGILYSGTSP
ncbi:hypothetical protein QR685DRAFT_587883 [Neurospora intermedia]|uniref:Uncharacterized protein n=1 Tax=Neurospora intermedia TaxID=5142 RepID=A0ABR3DDP3_NEUIN